MSRDTLKISDLPAPITAAKADWLPGTSWLGFTPANESPKSRNQCQSTIQKQFGNGYVIEYVTQKLSEPNSGFENEPEYHEELLKHSELAGRLIAVHRLRATSRRLEDIIGENDFRRLQDMWAQDGKRWRWSVAFPIVESYEIIGKPKAEDVLGEKGYRELFQRPSAGLRNVGEGARRKLDNLTIKPVTAVNLWIGLEDEFMSAARSCVETRIERNIQQDLKYGSFEGMASERLINIRIRAAWLAQKFANERIRTQSLFCDHCKFDPKNVEGVTGVTPRSLLDVHHINPMDEGVRYTTVEDFLLLCPTCHRIEHARLKIAKLSQ